MVISVWYLSDIFIICGNKKCYSFEKHPMLYNGIFGCHGNICSVILINAIFARCIVLIQSMCVPMLRSIGTKLTNLENIQKLYVYLTSRDTNTVRRTSWGWDTKVMAHTVVFMFWWPWPWPLTYVQFFCHTHWAWCTGISMQSFISSYLHVWCSDV